MVKKPDQRTITLMLCGDVMTGRGIDQILPHPGSPLLHESYVGSALDYVRLAEMANGPISRPVSYDYIWGDALAALRLRRPDAKIVNLETAVTRSGQPWPKGINYRMSPANLPCLAAAKIDCCVLANNHVMDWGADGLLETVNALHQAGLQTAGAGRNAEEAAAPAMLPVPDNGRVLVYAIACSSSGVPRAWAAAADRPGVNFLARPSRSAVESLAARIRRERRAGDIVVVSVHWGPNWGFQIEDGERSFAHDLIDLAGVDVMHGHSSHHVKAVEVHHGKPILYGCGDFLNDYEGIKGHEPYRDDLVLMYLCEIGVENRELARLDMVPFRLRNLRLNDADDDEAEWLRQTMDRESGRYGGSSVSLDRNNVLGLAWR